MRGIVRDWILPGAVGLLAATATALPLWRSLQRETDRVDQAAAGARRDLAAMPDEVREAVERFHASKASLEHRIAVIEELRGGRGDLVGIAESVLTQLPEDAEWLALAVSRRRLGMVVETSDPLAAVHFAEVLAADPGLERVDLERVTEDERRTERFLVSADLAEPPSHGAD